MVTVVVEPPRRPCRGHGHEQASAGFMVCVQSKAQGTGNYMPADIKLQVEGTFGN